MSRNIQYLKFEDNRYFFMDIPISRADHQKIRYGNWSRLNPDTVLKKLTNKNKLKHNKNSYNLVYESVLSSKEGQYMLGIAQEKVVNDMLNYLKKIKTESRRLVKANRQLPASA